MDRKTKKVAKAVAKKGIVVSCPSCGTKVGIQEVASLWGKRGGSVKSEAKRQAAFAREAKKREKRETTAPLPKRRNHG
jgi:hypothetical protein